MRIRLGILSPFFLQFGILFLYSSIRYQVIDRAIITLIILLIFPILVLYVMFPFIIVKVGRLETRISKRLDVELDTILLRNIQEDDSLENSRTILENNLFIQENKQVSYKLKSRLIPLITRRALENYKSTFYSRDSKIQAEKSLKYFEALFQFAFLSMVFFSLDMFVLIIMTFRSVNLYVIYLDQIIEFPIFFSLFAIFIFGILLSVILFRYSILKVEHFLPYVIPILFSENVDEKYLRRQTIRSLLSYNLDNLMDRKDQKKHGKLVKNVVEDLIEPLLKEELIITAQQEFTHRIAWREYSALLKSDLLSHEIKKDTAIEKLLIGNKIANIQIDDKDLFGLNSDLEYILENLNNWKTQSDESKIIAYFRLYRVAEYIIKEIGVALNIIRQNEENSMYNTIKGLFREKYLNENEVSSLQNLRFQRNKLMHQPGISLQISREIFIVNIDILNNLLIDISKSL